LEYNSNFIFLSPKRHLATGAALRRRRGPWPSHLRLGSSFAPSPFWFHGKIENMDSYITIIATVFKELTQSKAAHLTVFVFPVEAIA